MKKFYEGFPPSAHPMSVLSTMVASLSAYYPNSDQEEDVELLPVTVGSEGEVGIDIAKLRAQSGAITLDPGYGNTG